MWGSGVPVVTANRGIDNSSVPSVVNDDAQGIRLVLRHLHEKGHRRIAHIAGPEERSTGRLRRMPSGAKPQGSGWKFRSKRYSAPIGSMRTKDAVARQACSALVGRSVAVVCANDRLALGAIEAFRQKGLSCPEDVSVTGFNDLPFLGLIPPGLTTVRVKQFGVGRLSAEILLKMITEPDAPVAITTVLPVRL